MAALERRKERKIGWIDSEGRPAQPPVYNELPSKDISYDYPRMEDLSFRDPDSFVAGGVHSHVGTWEKICNQGSEAQRVLGWIKDGVDLYEFMVPFKGTYGGRQYDSPEPPGRIFKNNKSCEGFTQFIADTLEERITNGSLEVVGRVGECQPPKIVSPITIEPTKPRLCINLRYLNSWMKDTPFKLDTLVDIPKVVDRGAFLTSLDDKSSYDHVKITDRSRQLVGLAFQGWYMVYTTIPFGWKNSAFVYQSVNRQPMSYLRGLSVVGFVYIDDRLLEKCRQKWVEDAFEQAKLAIVKACLLLIQLGFTLALKKSILVPTQIIRFLGMLVDTVRQAFMVPDDKKEKLRMLRENILAQEAVSVQTLQRFQGKCVSLLLAVPGAKLYIREMAMAIGGAQSENLEVKISDALKEEIGHWRFLDDWEGFLPWRDERHMRVEVYTDSSNYKWGGVVEDQGVRREVGDYWPSQDCGLPIMVLEAKALLRVLQSFRRKLRNCRVDAGVDNLALMHSWEKEGSKSRELNEALKQIFLFTLEENVVLKLTYVQSKENVADAPSREIRKSDCMLSAGGWKTVQDAFGGRTGHEFDLMALDSNAMVTREGLPLPHYTPYPTPGSSGVNIFSQRLSRAVLYYVFPPFSLIPSVLRYVEAQQATVTIVVPKPNPLPVWFPKLVGMAKGAVLIGERGDRGALLYPTRKGYQEDKIGLSHSLWAVRLSPTSSQSENPYSMCLLGGRLGAKQGSTERLLIVSDSMLGFLLTSDMGRDPLVHVFAVSGGCLVGVLEQLCRLVRRVRPRLVVVHAGVNDLQARGKSEFDMMSGFESAARRLSHSGALRDSSSRKVVVSSIVCTKRSLVNARVEYANTVLRRLAEKCNWAYLDNSMIGPSDLRDGLHLNRAGERKFKANLMGVINSLV